jgi:hypothetical protein
VTCDLRQPPHPPRTSQLVDVGRATDRAGASPWSKVVLSYKTNGEGINGNRINERPMRGVELHGGFPCDHLFASQIVSPHGQGSILMSQNCD